MPDTARDLIKQTINNTPGTAGSLTLGAAVSSWLALGAPDDGKSFSVLILASDSDAAAKELRSGCIYTHSTTTLTRGTLVAGSAIDLTSSAVVSVVATADRENRRLVGPYASTAALESAYPAASNLGSFGLVGASAPYSPYISDGNTWAALIAAAAGDPYAAVASSGTSQSINMASAGVVDITLTGNCTLSLTGATAGAAHSVRVVLRQDSVGSRTVTWPAGTKWSLGVAPSLSTAANAIDEAVLTTFDGGTTVFGDFVAKGRA